uniref:Uncharacterized protein n=1 Tax=Siphoviridae sp. ctBCI9 TaxID=2825373 RepID=A0A8S5Q7I9_9CAUD|nr:MAG TPA: hypothetical protein [Siphoviridae sp. ctBCI9]
MGNRCCRGRARPARGLPANGIYRATTSGRRGRRPLQIYRRRQLAAGFRRGGVTPPYIGIFTVRFLVQSPPRHKTAIDNRWLLLYYGDNQQGLTGEATQGGWQ